MSKLKDLTMKKLLLAGVAVLGLSFGAMAADWWDPKGRSAMLHKLNPVRLGFIREAIDHHFAADERSLRPLEGRTALDVGCGAGPLAEPLARLGAHVTGGRYGSGHTRRTPSPSAPTAFVGRAVPPVDQARHALVRALRRRRAHCGAQRRDGHRPAAEEARSG